MQSHRRRIGKSLESVLRIGAEIEQAPAAGDCRVVEPVDPRRWTVFPKSSSLALPKRRVLGVNDSVATSVGGAVKMA